MKSWVMKMPRCIGTHQLPFFFLRTTKAPRSKGKGKKWYEYSLREKAKN